MRPIRIYKSENGYFGKKHMNAGRLEDIPRETFVYVSDSVILDNLYKTIYIGPFQVIYSQDLKRDEYYTAGDILDIAAEYNINPDLLLMDLDWQDPNLLAQERAGQ